MSTIYRAIFVVMMFALIMSFMVNFQSDVTTSHKLKLATEIAGHDALLQYDEVSYSSGKIIFNKSRARDAFLVSLEENLELRRKGNTLLQADGKGFLKNDVTIDRLVYIDNNTKPSDIASKGKLISPDGSSVKTKADGTVKFPLIYQDNTYVLTSGYTSYLDENGQQQYKKVDKGLYLARPGVVAVLSTTSPRWFKGDDTLVRQASAYNFVPVVMTSN